MIVGSRGNDVHVTVQDQRPTAGCCSGQAAATSQPALRRPVDGREPGAAAEALDLDRHAFGLNTQRPHPLLDKRRAPPAPPRGSALRPARRNAIWSSQRRSTAARTASVACLPVRSSTFRKLAGCAPAGGLRQQVASFAHGNLDRRPADRPQAVGGARLADDDLREPCGCDLLQRRGRPAGRYAATGASAADRPSIGRVPWRQPDHRRRRLQQPGAARAHRGRRTAGTRISPRPPLSGHIDPPLPTGAVDLTSGNPDFSFLPDLREAASRLPLPQRPYGVACDDADLLQVAADWLLRDGVSPDFLSVVSGGMSGIERALDAHLRPGDRVAVEDPSYHTVHDLLRAHGLIAQPVMIDEFWYDPRGAGGGASPPGGRGHRDAARTEPDRCRVRRPAAARPAAGAAGMAGGAGDRGRSLGPGGGVAPVHPHHHPRAPPLDRRPVGLEVAGPDLPPGRDGR